MADRPEMFGPIRGFSGWPIQWNHAKCCGADSCCHGNEILGKFGLYLHKIAYKSACMAHRPDMFGPTRGADTCCHGNDVWPRRRDLFTYRLVIIITKRNAQLEQCYGVQTCSKRSVQWIQITTAELTLSSCWKLQKLLAWKWSPCSMHRRSSLNTAVEVGGHHLLYVECTL